MKKKNIKCILLIEFLSVTLLITACKHSKTDYEAPTSNTITIEKDWIIPVTKPDNNIEEKNEVITNPNNSEEIMDSTQNLIIEDNTNKEDIFNIEDSFYIEEISADSELFGRIRDKSFKSDCTTPLSDLRYLHVLHVDFDGNIKEGEIICNKAIADDLLEIFTILYKEGYQIEKIRLVDEYDADDERSMADNNSSSFNFRFISYTTTVSKHGLGMAIDINPLYNPYVKTINGKLNIEPSNATDYVDREQDFDHKIDENDLAYKLFIEHGFTWGGAWKNSKDYQHFEKK